MTTLRSKLIRLAHERPELRPDLLPILKEGGGWRNRQLQRDYEYTMDLHSEEMEEWEEDRNFVWTKGLLAIFQGYAAMHPEDEGLADLAEAWKRRPFLTWDSTEPLIRRYAPSHLKELTRLKNILALSTGERDAGIIIEWPSWRDVQQNPKLAPYFRLSKRGRVAR